MLDVTRDEVEAFCRASGLRPRRDPSNEDTTLLRNAIRLEVMPEIERATGRKVRDTFARTAGLLRADADALWEQAVELADTMVDAQVDDGSRGFAIKADALTALTPPMASRVVRRAFQLADLPWTEAAIEATIDLAEGRPGRRRDLRSGLRVVREREYVRGSGPSPERSTADHALDRSQGDDAVTLTHHPLDATLAAHVDAYEPHIEKTLISSEEIQRKLAEMGAQITADYEGRSLLFVGVLKGAFVVMADLARHVRLPLEFDFMAVSSYGAATKTSGVVRILKDLDHDLEGQDVLLVEDIVDSGTDPEVPAEEPRRAQARVARGGCPAAQDRPAEGAAGPASTWGSTSPPSSSSGTGWTSTNGSATSRTSPP